MRIAEVFLKGWFTVMEIDSSGMLIEDKIRNYQIYIDSQAWEGNELELRRGWIVRLETWAECLEQEKPYRRYSCQAIGKVRHLPCRPNEGVWVSGEQYC
jgi:hypothetical protein